MAEFRAAIGFKPSINSQARISQRARNLWVAAVQHGPTPV